MPSVAEESIFVDGYKDWWEGRWMVSQGGDGEQTYGQPADLYWGIVDTLVAERRIRTILDVGCGACNQWRTNSLPVPDRDFTGIEISARAIVHAERKHRDASFICGDITQADLWEAAPSADLVVCTEVLNHIEPEHYKPLVARIFCTAEKAVILRMWQKESLHGAGGYHWDNPVPEVDGWDMEEYAAPNSSANARIYVYVRR